MMDSPPYSAGWRRSDAANYVSSLTETAMAGTLFSANEILWLRVQLEAAEHFIEDLLDDEEHERQGETCRACGLNWPCPQAEARRWLCDIWTKAGPR